MLSEEEKKAIEMIEIIVDECKLENKRKGYEGVYYDGDTPIPYKEYEIVLNLITKLQKENEILKRAFDKQTADMSNNLLELQQKDKQIDLMAEVMFKSNKAQLLIEYGIENKEQIIKEFEKLVKEKGE